MKQIEEIDADLKLLAVAKTSLAEFAAKVENKIQVVRR